MSSLNLLEDGPLPGAGFFPEEALASQAGVPPSDAERAIMAQPAEHAADLRARPPKFFADTARLPGPMLLMLDRVTGYWPDAGRAGLGRVRACKDVDPGEWFFRAHFFQDPAHLPRGRPWHAGRSRRSALTGVPP